MKIVRVYKNSGLAGLFKTGGEKVLRGTGNKLVETANHLLKPGRLSRRDRELLERNLAFKDKHSGQRCFILANGPSLAKQDICPLGSEITFVANNFWRHEVLEEWQPTYYVLADPLLLAGSEQTNDLLRNIGSRVPNSTFFVRKNAVQIISEQKLLPPEQVYYLAFAGRLMDTDLTYIDLTNYLPGPRNVGILSVMLAIYMGCSPIYLMGFDHDWLAKRGVTGHFYRDAAGQGEPAAKPPSGFATWSYQDLMEHQLELWKGYDKLARLANEKGIRILNATNGGYLDVYERVNYEHVVGLPATETQFDEPA